MTSLFYFARLRSSDPVRKTNKQRNGLGRKISYLTIKTIKTGQRSQTIDISSYNPWTVALSTRPPFAQTIFE